MVIKRFLIEEVPIQRFAIENRLTMEVRERSTHELPRFYAQFSGAEVGSFGTLASVFGDGDSESEAIADYAKRISGKILVLNAYSKWKRREIQVPKLAPYTPTPS